MIVVKVGGGKGINYEAVTADLAELHAAGQKIVLVHGGSYETNVLSEKLGHPPKFVTSVSGYESRYTDRETLEIFEMVYCGKVNKRIVEMLQAKGVNAVGLSGIDGRLLEGTRKDAIKIIDSEGRKRILRDDFTGKVEKVNTGLLTLLLDNGYLPVVTPPAISYAGEAINVDGDRAAAIIASSLGVDQLIILSNVPGLLRDVKDESSLITHIEKAFVEESMSFAEGRFKKKVMGASEALQEGVKEVIFADARVDKPISAAIAHNGTVIS
ncbi:MAG: [LysW]-aminoadipate kinase [Chloroflexi bacterium]|uniref:Putative [LysW]-aminoadipate kinase n=1 Tax=Candidatus Chlorohelix allophototropha TaxID=3003348 RepID=A0A8T7LVS8_9CHLR|nr:[LysW]-aminoadipate kinase [Chloroflexota bacterium]WJW66884.1 [LysW]-aminoadipate kinase [Chloroflexota bacterium L227-S17]